VQKELWMPVYNGDFIPSRPQMRTFNNGKSWSIPFIAESGWGYEDAGATFNLNSSEKARLGDDTNAGNNFQATYAYNPPVWYKYQEECSDFRVGFWVRDIDPSSTIGAKISKYGRDYTAKVDFEAAKLLLQCEYDDKTTLIGQMDISRQYPLSPVKFEFNNADYRLTLKFGNYTLQEDIGLSYGDIGTYNDGTAAIELFGKGKLSINHLAIDRDIHYVSRQMMSTDEIRSGEGNPITLGEGEFFACGDNSPQSLDSRLWTEPGIGNSQAEYPLGIVPRDYLIGQAFYVYWPGSYKTKPRGKSIGFIPNVGKMRWIYSGE